MAVYSIWESRFPSGSAADGLRITTAIWDDMPGYDGYLGHEIVRPAATPSGIPASSPAMVNTVAWVSAAQRD